MVRAENWGAQEKALENFLEERASSCKLEDYEDEEGKGF